MFHEYRPAVEETGIRLDDLLDMLHGDDRSPENPIVSEAIEVFGQLPHMADIRGGYAVFEDVTRRPEAGELRVGGQLLKTSRKICRLMEGADQMAVFVCTAGQGFSEYAKRYQQEGEYLKSYLADALGSVVAERSMDFVQAQLEQSARQEGLAITNRYSPGYCNWPVDDQRKLFSLLPSGVCGISLTASCLMTPIKSVSGIIGIGRQARKSDYGCDICNNRTCIYRRVKNKKLQTQ